MALPDSGRLTLSMVATEFKVVAPYTIKDLFTVAKIPSSGGVRKMSAFYGLSAAPPHTWSAQRKLVASDKTSNDYFGQSCSVSSDGNTVVVGAPLKDHRDNRETGAAYVFVRQNGTWIEQAKLTSPYQASNDRLGYSCSISGDGNTIIVGSILADPSGVTSAGTASIFIKQGNAWTHHSDLVDPHKAKYDYFGHACSISRDGNTIVITAYSEDPDSIVNAGSAYIFERQGSSWNYQTKLFASDKLYYDYFGQSCSISSDGNTVVVGAPLKDPDNLASAGVTYIFTKQGNVWSEQVKLTASDKAKNDYFGQSCSVSSDGSIAVVGAPRKNASDIYEAGAAYVFIKQGSTWSQHAKLVAEDKSISDYFGQSCSVSGDGNTIVVGSHLEDPDSIVNAGSAYIFERQGGSWVQRSKLVAFDKTQDSYFGYSCSLSEDGGLITIGEHRSEYGAGALYIFQREEV